MKVFQLIRHEYNSDDGHYESAPVDDDAVHQNEVAVLAERDRLNLASVTMNNRYVAAEVCRRWKEWEKNGKVDPPPRNLHGIQYHDPCSTKGIADYERKSLYTGDPTDLDAIERFAGWHTCLTYYTCNTLEVLP